ncbi:uncharacterized protein LOC121390765 [Gigantopelta aegis]|uniref:uncharacterized protein LOC121390765 n=1 Tax=Gigantopelta aegis TaxID=1735272 RepID=UPI001B889FAD|nr:uncharacterized protein LOC121390765 [Gigantopelta aegis]
MLLDLRGRPEQASNHQIDPVFQCLLEKRQNKNECDLDPDPVPDPDPEKPRRKSVTFSSYLPTRRSVMESVMESEGRYNEGNENDTESEDSLDRYYVREDGDNLREKVDTESESSEEEVESSDETESGENVSHNFKEESATDLQNRQQYKQPKSQTKDTTRFYGTTQYWTAR